MSAALRIAVVGLGKIAHDQHLPAIAASTRFELVAAASPGARARDIPVFEDLDALLAANIAVDALALCQPPQQRFEAAVKAIHAGKHVLLEKPPGACLNEAASLATLAARADTSVFTAWHSRHAPGVERARAWLATRELQSVEIRWQEDVRHWHAGQQWIWEPGGMGVFDAGINALSILSLLVPGTIVVLDGTLQVPRNRRTPIAAEIHMRSQSGAPLHAVFDWRSSGAPTWEIQARTDGGTLQLSAGGARLVIAERPCELPAPQEYAEVYRHFARLIDARQSDVELTPLRLVADAFMRCASCASEPFEDPVHAGV